MIDRRFLLYAFDEDNFPDFICPRCNQSVLARPKDFATSHPKFSEIIQNEPWGDVDMVELRISEKLTCSSPSCGEHVSFYAIGKVQHCDDQNGDMYYETYFHTKSIYPSPWIINIPKSTPSDITKSLYSAFNSVWFDKGLAANALRRSLELLLNHLGIPDEIDGNWQSLGHRINKLEATKPDDADFYQAVKKIVNQGSHQDVLETSTILDVFETLEFYLERLFDEKHERYIELKAQLHKHNS